MRRVPISNKSLVCLAVSSLLTFLLASRAAAIEREPYEARVVMPGASVHSGPGENFYATDTLPQGEVVEVYREEPGGWLGVRPTEGSFSWIFGSHVTRRDGSLAEIDKDDVASRIGSRLGNQKNAVQVRLRRGEVIEILGETTIEGKKWYKIAPPSGEFRWIHSRNVQRVGAAADGEFAKPADASAPPIVTVPVADSPAAEPAAGEQQSPSARESSAVTLIADSQPETNPEWRAAPTEAAEQSSATHASPEGNVSDKSRSDNAEPPVTVAIDDTPLTSTPTKPGPPAEAILSQSASTSVPPITPIPNDDVSRQLIDIELRLSRTVAEPPATWQIEPLRLQTQQLISQAASDAERAELQSTLAKLDRFAAIAQQYQQGVRRGESSTSSTEQGAIAGRPNSSLPAPSPLLQPDTSRYDAVGTLRPVVSKRPGAPQFALVDDRGQVVSFVTPSPDVNLQPYVGHRIGVTGSRGFIPEFQRSHVTAGRVSPLGGRIVR